MLKPKTSVLNREPVSDDTSDCCPPLLWSLQQTHKVNRGQMYTQLRKWKEGKNKGTLSKSKVNLLKQYCKQLLNKMVPSAKNMIKEAHDYQIKRGTLLEVRPETKDLNVWNKQIFVDFLGKSKHEGTTAC